MLQTRLARPVAARPVPENLKADLPTTLLRLAAKIEAGRILIVAEHGFDLLCLVIRRGCQTATSIRPTGRPEAGSADLLLLPCVTDFASLELVIRLAGRVLVPGGRLVVGLPTCGPSVSALSRRLRLNGFAAMRTAHTPNATVLRADLRDRAASIH